MFEKFIEKEYTYRGKVQLVKDYYTEKQVDEKGNMRDVYIFPLGLIEKVDIKKIIVDKNLNKSIKKAKRKTKEELLKIIEGNESKKCSTRNVSTVVFERNQYIAEFVKRRADGKCELCGENAPFKDKDGTPYLEAHHVTWLSNGGEDSIENSLALCPNCHKKMHIVNSQIDVQKLYDRLMCYQQKFIEKNKH